ncbi:VOC family protein [Flexivirga meconopsidis]|uniref:VOC family protein n=1 Tax=Flexivirga meconopsidis TaxID=2977121 RepID=UPI00223EB141|nr:VOC family protein [Flexivirga meconopsidis]
MSDQNPSAPTASIAMVSIDCDDAKAMADFYSAVLGWPLAYADDEGNYAMLQDGDQRLGFGKTPDYQRPDWPNHGSKQFHLDLGAEDVDGTVARCVELGATKPDEQPGGDRWTVLLDPAGHPFCVTNLANWG